MIDESTTREELAAIVCEALRADGQFVNAPVAVGEKRRVEPVEIRTSKGILLTISPLDCVLDRLAWFLHWAENEPGKPDAKRERLQEFFERLEKRKR